MKLNKILTPALGLLLALSSCSEGKYWDEPTYSQAPACVFPKTAEKLVLAGDEQLSTVTVTVSRTIAGEAETVALASYVSDPEVAQVPESVTFAEGAYTAEFEVSLGTVMVGTNYTVQIALPGYVRTTKADVEKFGGELAEIADPEANTLQSVNATHLFTLSLSRALIYEDLGWVEYTDDFITGMIGGVECLTYYVRIQKAVGADRYRLVNAYGEDYGYNEPGDYSETKESYIEIICDDPTRVYIPNWQIQYTDWGYGNFLMGSRASLYLENGNSADAIAEAGYFGKLENGKITFPVNGLLITTVNDLADGFWGANKNGAFLVDLNTLTATNPN